MDETLVKTNEHSFRPMNVIIRNTSLFFSNLYSTDRQFYVSYQRCLCLLVTFDKHDDIFHTPTRRVWYMQEVSHQDHKANNYVDLTILITTTDQPLVKCYIQQEEVCLSSKDNCHPPLLFRLVLPSIRQYRQDKSIAQMHSNFYSLFPHCSHYLERTPLQDPDQYQLNYLLQASYIDHYRMDRNHLLYFFR